VLAALSDQLRVSGYELKPVLAALFRSQAFYSDAVIAAQIKSPAVLVAGALKQLRAQIAAPQPLNAALRQMGQVLFDPPTVKGWDGGRAWINTTTLLARYNFAGSLLHGAPMGRQRRVRPEGAAGRRADEPRRRRAVAEVDVAALYDPAIAGTPEAVVDHLARILLAAPLREALRAELVAHLKSSSEEPEARVRGLIHLLMSTPNYQLC
jgi:uncharacterized protein (DUF1800 family)